ncbi:ADP-ribosylation factor-like protein 14 [Epinephelus lanceolatus]|uniref:ADP-ribosylation factor-like protein 14 n=1 Tax=Epinephelus lanceolatus TaxID=310571 RepID=UPI0014488FCB|nr:ADP-ribosylation factor-like protein 14 [Epinephelus lanceolatus]XP_049913794.1 ADP-ribosylation factor-like protein 14 [Epinephelus moara]
MGMHESKPQQQAHVLMLGLDGAGKTTLLYKLKYNESVVTVPTVGFNVETLETDRSSPGLTVWDVGGQKKMRPHWKHHYPDTAGLVFVVDSWDQKRLDEARKELRRVLRHECLRGVPLVIFANKQDLHEAMSIEALCLTLYLEKLCEGRAWFVQPCSATTGMGLEEGFRRIAYLMKTPFKQTQEDIKVKMRSKGFSITALKKFLLCR